MVKNHIHLVWELAKRDLRARYVGSTLGILWAFLQPLLQLLLFTFVFSTVLKISLAGERGGGESFPLFLFAGLLPWMGVQEMVQRSTTVLVDQSALVKKLAFPPHLLVAGTLVSAAVHQALAAAVFLAVLGAMGRLAWTALWLVPLMALQVLLVAGACFLCAALQVFFRDTAQLVGYGLMVLFYGTPIVYPLSLVHQEGLRTLLAWNPAARLVEAFRDVLLRGQAPPAADLALLLMGGAVVTWAGLWAFSRGRAQFADLL
jgi:ABC-type polysaccharide/polyol phosphate export permease